MGLKAFNKEKEFKSLSKKNKVLIILSTSLGCLAILTIFLYQSFAAFVDTKTHNFVNATVGNFGPCEGENCGVLKMAEANSGTTKWFLGTVPLARNTIEELVFTNTNKVPTDLVATSIDVSLDGDGSVKAWWEPIGTNNRYKVTIGAKDGVKAPTNSSYLFAYLTYLNELDFTHFSTYDVEDMQYMFRSTGYNSTTFTLDLGSNFDTSTVTNMECMFFAAGFYSTAFTLDFRDKFNTSLVENMLGMFNSMGNRSEVLQLDLSQVNFNTIKVNNMAGMFSGTGSYSEVFTLNLGPNFDTKLVTDMQSMFYNIGAGNPEFTLNLGTKFDTSLVTNMYGMFQLAGAINPNFELDLGPNFKTHNVTVSMRYMFSRTGVANPNFKLNMKTMSFEGNPEKTMMFSSGPTNPTIYVKDAAAVEFITNGASLRSDATVINCSTTACP